MRRDETPANVTARTLAVLLLLLAATLFAVTSLGAAQAPPAYGAESPQAVMAGLADASATEDFGKAMTFLAPEARVTAAREMLQGLLFGLALSNPDDRMPGSPALSKADLQKKRTAYNAAVDATRAALQAHGLDGIVGQKPMAPATMQMMDTGVAKADTVALVTALKPAVDQIGALLTAPHAGMTKEPFPFAFGAVANYRVQGDKASAKAATEALDFVRIGGRWYLTPPPRP
ncbi:MAG TPA: hypothetical protein VMW48_04960 [Vicinamibacterales bacterium]|nr:hypothetical protein [Vicinamibacterales bacterium]